MDRHILKKMQENLEQVILTGKLHGKKAVVFGSNEPAEQIVKYFLNKNITVAAMVDNNPLKKHTVIDGVMVYSPEEYLLPYDENILIFIASKYYTDMVLQLKQLGYHEKEQVIQAVQMTSYAASSLTNEEFCKWEAVVQRGEKVLHDILQKNSEINYEKIFAYPPVYLGDIMIGLRYFREYLKKNNIQNYCIITTSGSCRKILKIYGLEEYLYTIEADEMNALLQYFVFTDMLEGKAVVISHFLPYTTKHSEVGNYRGINFADEFRYGLYELDSSCQYEIPNAIYHSSENMNTVYQLFEQHNLQSKNTVILFPYAKSASLISENFWIQAVEILQKKGFSVCTNSSGSDEPAIPGTSAINCPLESLREFVENAGYMLALRSGVCDLLSSAKANKVIIYPDRFHGPGTFRDYFSTKDMGFDENVKEIIWTDNIDVQKIVADLIP